MLYVDHKMHMKECQILLSIYLLLICLKLCTNARSTCNQIFLSLLLPRKRMTGWDRMMFGLLRSWTVEQTLSSKCWSCTPSSPIWESNHWHPALVTAHQRPLSLSLSHSPRFDDDNPEQYSPHTILPLYAAWSEMETRFSIFKQLVAVLENLN